MLTRVFDDEHHLEKEDKNKRISGTFWTAQVRGGGLLGFRNQGAVIWYWACQATLSRKTSSSDLKRGDAVASMRKAVSIRRLQCLPVSIA